MVLGLIRAGDHLLVTDSAYYPTRSFCDSLRRFGVEVEYYDPRVGAGIKNLFRPGTRAVYLESPGSLTLEIQDVPAIVDACRTRKILTLADNTWATPLFFQPLRLGVDVSIHSATKYITGHADSYLGVIVCNERAYPDIRHEALRLGQCAAPDDIYLGLRGLRTLHVRLQHQQKQALKLAHWLDGRPEVDQVLHPALPGSLDHELWKRDFQGSAGVFSLVLKSGYPSGKVDAMLDGYEHFKLGHSYGGFESLVMQANPGAFRTQSQGLGHGKAMEPVVRLQVGMEDIDDLQADLERGFARLGEA